MKINPCKYYFRLMFFASLIIAKTYYSCILVKEAEVSNIKWFKTCYFQILVKNKSKAKMAGSALRRLMAEYKQLSQNPPDGKCQIK